jgi:hypothetical protein
MELDGKGIFRGRLFTETDQGRNAHATIKAMGELQEWSYGYEILDSSPIKSTSRPGARALALKSLDVYEVSPVLLGAAGRGNTGTIAIKAAASNVAETAYMVASILRLIEGESLAAGEEADVLPLRIALASLMEWMGTEVDLVGSPEDMERVRQEREAMGLAESDSLADLLVKALPSDRSGIPLAGSPLGDQTVRMLEGVTRWKERVGAITGIRLAEGRAISAQRRNQIQSVADALGDVEDLRKALLALLEETDPAKREKAARTALAEFLRIESRTLLPNL